MPPIPMLLRTLRPLCFATVKRDKIAYIEAIQEAEITWACTIPEAKATHVAAVRDAKTQRASQTELLQREHGKIMRDLEEQVIRQESSCQSDFLLACQATLHTSPVELKGMLVASSPSFVGAGPYIPLIFLLPKISTMEEWPTPAAPPAPVPKQSSQA